MQCTFEIPGKPVPKKRPRRSSAGPGAPKWYTPSETQEFEERVGWFAARARPEGWPERVYYTLRWVAYFPNHRIPDADNVSKSVADGCEGILWFNDCRVRKTAHETLTVPSMDSEGRLRIQVVTLDKSDLERAEPPWT